MTRANVKPWRQVSLVIVMTAGLLGAWWQMHPTSRVLGRTQHADGSFSIDLVSANDWRCAKKRIHKMVLRIYQLWKRINS